MTANNEVTIGEINRLVGLVGKIKLCLGGGVHENLIRI